MYRGLSELEKFKLIRPVIGNCEYDDNMFPIIRKTDVSRLDWENVHAQNIQNLSKNGDNRNALVTMFRYDCKLMRLWNDPLKKIALFRTCMAVATPDFSYYPSMNINDIRHNVYMNRWLGRTWQNYGVNVIATIGWAGADTYDLCLSAVEKGSPVIISTLGCKNNKEMFLAGFKEMKKRIIPPVIIVVGDMIDGMTGTFVNFKYEDPFVNDPSQLKFKGISPVFDVKEVV
ncbi:DUF4417 domain-containing protein [Ruminococcus sp.]|uniref:DUF4417 domain-containing protein n=1 Tax=Ruminococcus sp. TaxID=41978 RepID=UPI0025F6D974|nr:DUF4417 domain-containing protein [Ruminococcus sp.]MBR1432301.1 DUF4417 domain-containing protein [Ruminococcus sp.]